MIGQYWKKLQNVQPVVHNITNYVTVNDVANILLALGASPIMSDDRTEVEEIVSLCQALVINIGTLNKRTIESMFLAGHKATQLGIPIVLDPVGAGASSLRTETSKRLCEELPISVIRGNVSEIKALFGEKSDTRGVDASAQDQAFGVRASSVVKMLRHFAQTSGAVIVASGETDLVTDATTSYLVYNGSARMPKVTGTGCQLSALLGAYLGANPSSQLEAALAGVVHMGLAGEIAEECLLKDEGNSTYRNRLIDAIDNMTDKRLEAGARYEQV